MKGIWNSPVCSMGGLHPKTSGTDERGRLRPTRFLGCIQVRVMPVPVDDNVKSNPPEFGANFRGFFQLRNIRYIRRKGHVDEMVMNKCDSCNFIIRCSRDLPEPRELICTYASMVVFGEWGCFLVEGVAMDTGIQD